MSNHRVLSASLAEVESSSRRWENEARGSVEMMARGEAERDATRHDAQMARIMARLQNGVLGQRWSSSWLGYEMSWLLQSRLGGRRTTKLAV